MPLTSDGLQARWPKCKTFQWSGDWELSVRFGSSAQRTRDGEQADFFVVPFLSKCFYNFAAKYRLKAMDTAMGQVLSFLRGHPWWERRKEAHVFFFMSGVGRASCPRGDSTWSLPSLSLLKETARRITSGTATISWSRANSA